MAASGAAWELGISVDFGEQQQQQQSKSQVSSGGYRRGVPSLWDLEKWSRTHGTVCE